MEKKPKNTSKMTTMTIGKTRINLRDKGEEVGEVTNPILRHFKTL